MVACTRLCTGMNPCDWLGLSLSTLYDGGAQCASCCRSSVYASLIKFFSKMKSGELEEQALCTARCSLQDQFITRTDAKLRRFSVGPFNEYWMSETIICYQVEALYTPHIVK